MALTKEDLQAIGDLIDGKLAPMRADIVELRDNLDAIRNSVVIIELEQLPRIAAALEGVMISTEKNAIQDKRISVLENTVEDHDDRIFVLEQAVKAQ